METVYVTPSNSNPLVKQDTELPSAKHLPVNPDSQNNPKSSASNLAAWISLYGTHIINYFRYFVV